MTASAEAQAAPAAEPVAGRRRRMLATAGRAIHALRGSRSLVACGLLVLLLTLFGSAFPPNLVPLFSGAAVVLLALGLATLAREGSAAQANLTVAVEDMKLARQLVILLILPGLLVALLLPRLFLAAYGIPHMTPLTGLVLPSLQRQVGLVFLAVILILPIMALRQARRRLGAPPVLPPNKLADHDPIHARRDLLLACTLAVAIVWLLLMHTFWAPFSLIGWPPSLVSLDSVRGITAVAFTLAPPVTLFMLIAVHAELGRVVARVQDPERRARLLTLTLANILFLLLAVALHAYDLLWIARYNAGSSS